ncbi:MAG: hypothetical protein IPH82_13450 [Chloroflexi bacterium]|nr:hypothetical protein [Chloroflexota bacterium]
MNRLGILSRSVLIPTTSVKGWAKPDAEGLLRLTTWAQSTVTGKPAT